MLMNLVIDQIILVIILKLKIAIFTVLPKWLYCSWKCWPIIIWWYIWPINSAIKIIIITIPIDIQFIPFFLYYVFNSKLSLICFLHLVFIIRSSNIFSIKIFSMCPRYYILSLFNRNHFFCPNRLINFCSKLFLAFDMLISSILI